MTSLVPVWGCIVLGPRESAQLEKDLSVWEILYCFFKNFLFSLFLECVLVFVVSGTSLIDIQTFSFIFFRFLFLGLFAYSEQSPWVPRPAFSQFSSQPSHLFWFCSAAHVGSVSSRFSLLVPGALPQVTWIRSETKALGSSSGSWGEGACTLPGWSAGKPGLFGRLKMPFPEVSFPKESPAFCPMGVTAPWCSWVGIPLDLLLQSSNPQLLVFWEWKVSDRGRAVHGGGGHRGAYQPHHSFPPTPLFSFHPSPHLPQYPIRESHALLGLCGDPNLPCKTLGTPELLLPLFPGSCPVPQFSTS